MPKCGQINIFYSILFYSKNIVVAVGVVCSDDAACAGVMNHVAVAVAVVCSDDAACAGVMNHAGVAVTC